MHKINTPVNMALNKPLDCQRLLYTNKQGKVNAYAKMKSNYCKKSVLGLVKACENWSDQIVRTVFWNVPKEVVLKF